MLGGGEGEGGGETCRGDKMEVDKWPQEGKEVECIEEKMND